MTYKRVKVTTIHEFFIYGLDILNELYTFSLTDIGGDNRTNVFCNISLQYAAYLFKVEFLINQCFCHLLLTITPAYSKKKCVV